MKRSLLALPLALGLLAGCAGQLRLPPPEPTPAQIQTQMSAVAAIAPADVPAYYDSGLYLVRSNCVNGFFSGAVTDALQAAQQQGEINIIGGLALSAAGLAGIGGPAAAGAGAGLSAINGLFANNLTNTLGGTDPAALGTLVITEQEAVINAMPEPTTSAQAMNQIHAANVPCTPYGVQAAKEQALAAAPNHVVVSNGTPPVAPSLRGLVALPPRHNLPIPSVR